MELIMAKQPRLDVVRIDFEAIKEQVDLLSVVEKEVVLKKRGTKYSGLCPFHNEHTPSFYVIPAQRYWYCHGCHKGGDVIHFVALINQIEVYEAASQLMKGVVPVSSDARLARMEARMIAEMDKRRQRLVEPPEGLQELLEYRGYKPQTIATFGLQAKCGARKGADIYIPIRDEDGVLVGYSFRRSGTQSPKYLHSKGLVKSDVLFGLDVSRFWIAQNQEAIVVEGQFDAIRLWDHGYRNVVAIMGSELSQAQALTLSKYASRLRIYFDGDAAGRKGAAKTMERFASAFDITIYNTPDGEDPDSNPRLHQ